MAALSGAALAAFEAATVIELARDSVNFRYPAFMADSTRGEPVYEPTFMLNSRCGDIKEFEYDDKTRTLFYEYQTDDLTPIRRDDDDENDQGQIIRQVLYWNGERFNEK